MTKEEKIQELLKKKKEAQKKLKKSLLAWTEATKGQFMTGHENAAAEVADSERRVWESYIQELDEEIRKLKRNEKGR